MLERDLESERLKIQYAFERKRTQEERKRLGQFATPTLLAQEILAYAKSLLPLDTEISFLDPAIGTGSFYSALLKVFPGAQITSAIGYEIDPWCGLTATDFWCEHGIKLHIADFTRAIPPDTNEKKPNLLICNPPYVRHHYLQKAEKQRLQKLAERETGIKLSEQAGLYGHFLLLAHGWLAENGLAGWLIPGEFMSVNYGRQIREYLLSKVTLLHVHCFSPEEVQFEDALVSSAIVWFKKAVPPDNHIIQVTYGGTLLKPAISKQINSNYLSSMAKWSGLFLETGDERSQLDEDIKKQASKPGEGQVVVLPGKKRKQIPLSDFFEVKRGIATGANKYFILEQKQVAEYRIPEEFLTPVLPNPRYLKSNVVEADDEGNPILDQRLYLLTCNLPEEEIEHKHPSLWRYLQIGVERGINHGYLCQSRKLWYVQERRPDCTFLCAYMGRMTPGKSTPFRFLLNLSKATVTNSYHILYPKPVLKKVLQDRPDLVELIWRALEAITTDSLIGEGRVYGGGMYKMEPGELANIPASTIIHLIQPYLTPAQIDALSPCSMVLF